MKKKILTTLALGFLITEMLCATNADAIPVYKIGSTHSGYPLNPNGTYVLDNDGVPIYNYKNYYALNSDTPPVILDGSNEILWAFVVSTSGWATLSIIAEGIDKWRLDEHDGEEDEVYFNDEYKGLLTQQSFYSDLFTLNTGTGALAGVTELTESLFTVWAKVGINTVRIVVDPDNWVNQIETSTLTPIPEPATMLLFGTGLVGLATISRRKRN